MMKSGRTLLFVGIAVFSRGPAFSQTDAEEREGGLRIICFGAHPDDAEYKSGGTRRALGSARPLCETGLGYQWRYRALGHGGWCVGEAPHGGVGEVARQLGVTSQVLDIHDGELEPSLENRRTITRLIRDWRADIVISHRPWDYHPDHRYVGILVQDAAYMVAVPFFCPDTPPLKRNPVFLYSSDGFRKPYPFEADIAVAIDEVFEQKVDALTALVSQTFEGGALGSAEKMAQAPPESRPELRREWLKERWVRRAGKEADSYRETLVRWYGPERGRGVKYAEAFEICEYGRIPGGSGNPATVSVFRLTD